MVKTDSKTGKILVKIADFGFSKLVNGTTTNVNKGTGILRPPEIKRDIDSNKITY